MTIERSDTPVARLATANFCDQLQRQLENHFADWAEASESPDRAGLKALREALEKVRRTGFHDGVGRDFLATTVKDLIAARKEEHVKLLIESFDGVNMHLTHMADSVPLVEAARNDLPRLCKWLIERGADVDFRSCASVTPLSSAICFASIDVVKMLLDAGADVHNESPRASAVLFAVRNGGPEILRLLVARGADPNVRLLDGYTALSYAAKSVDSAWAIEELVALGCDPNAKDGFDMRPVDWAVTASTMSDQSPQAHPLVRLLAAGADLDLMLPAVAESMETNLTPETLRVVRAFHMEKKLGRAMSGVPFDEDIVHNVQENAPRQKSSGMSPL